jgi:hypothetical protein
MAVNIKNAVFSDAASPQSVTSSPENPLIGPHHQGDHRV